MIEVKHKVWIEASQLQEIEQSATLINTESLADIYYDTENFRFTKNDIWLRERNCRFELKIGLKNFDGSFARYLEISDEKEILQYLGLNPDTPFFETISQGGLSPYATFQSIHRKYQLQSFLIALDLAYFEDFIYRSAEISLRVSDQEKLPSAQQEIDRFMQQFKIDPKRPVRAKLIEYLYHKNPDHYSALLTSGMVTT